jgi:hypothetical protein
MPLPVREMKVGVVGAGLMGAEIALVFALAGPDVLLNDRDPAALDAALARLGTLLDRGVAREASTPKSSAQPRSNESGLRRISPAFADRDLVTEAVFESLEVKSEVLAALDRECPATCVIASNTSTLPISTLSATPPAPAAKVPRYALFLAGFPDALGRGHPGLRHRSRDRRWTVPVSSAPASNRSRSRTLPALRSTGCCMRC